MAIPNGEMRPDRAGATIARPSRRAVRIRGSPKAVDSRNPVMDIASLTQLNSAMRLGLLVSCFALAPLASVFGQGAVPPSFTVHPASVTSHPEEVVTLTATVEGTLPITYQWLQDGLPLPGETNSTILIITSLATPAATYQVVATNAAGSATSLPALVYITKRTQTITFTAPTLVNAGTGVTLTATASSGLPVTLSLLSGPASLSGSLLTGTGGGDVVVKASQAGNGLYAAAESVDRTVRFVAGALSPFITSPLVDQLPLVGTRLSLQVASLGTPTPTYQWQKDGNPIPGATLSSYVVPTLTLADTGPYTVTATNLAGTATSSAQITVQSAPVLVTAPASQSVAAGTSARLALEVQAYPAPTFQWRRNGAAVPGATGSVLVLENVSGARGGDYDVVVTNSLGTLTSPVAILTVVTRDFSGTYFGRLADGSGECVLQVRNDGTAAFFAHLPTQTAGVAALDLKVDFFGNLTGRAPLIANTTRELTFTGTIDEVAGRATGTIAGLDTSFEASRAAASTPPAATAGVYTVALIGSGAARGYVVVASDGQGYVITAAGTTIDAGRGSVGANGRLAITTSTNAAVDVGFAEGVARGTVRTAAGVSGNIAGASEAISGGERLVNLSVRGNTSNPEPLITGFVISGTGNQQVLIRIAGPAIARAPFNITTALTGPNLQLFRSTTVIGQNNNWGNPAANGTAVRNATALTGAFPFANGSNDAAVAPSLQPGVYSVAVGGGNGTVLAEVYEVPAANERPGLRRLVNASTRALVNPNAPLIAGFVLTGAAPQRVLIRAIGPRLGQAPFNLDGELANPQVSLYRGSTLIRTNDDWFRDPEAALIRQVSTQVRAFALGNQSLDAALITYLEPGAYTAVVTGPPNVAAAAATGIALVEIYEANP